MGTFRIYGATTIESKTGAWAWWNTNGDLPNIIFTNPYILAALLGSNLPEPDDVLYLGMGRLTVEEPGGDGTIRFGWGLDDSIISLDDEEPISFNNLPAGFTPDSFTFSCFIQGLYTTDSIEIQLDSGTVLSSLITNDRQLKSISYLTIPTMLNLILNGFGIKSIFADNESAWAAGDTFIFEGTYTIVAPEGDPQDWYYDPTTETYQFSYNPCELIMADCPWILASNAGVSRPWKNPTTGVVTFAPTNPGTGWIPWIPSVIPPIFKLPVYITPDIIVPDLIDDFIPIQFIPLKGPSPVVFVPINFVPLPPFVSTPFVPTIFTPMGFPEPEVFDDGSFLIASNPAVDTDNGYTVFVGGSFIFVFIASPSGIYTLVKGKTNDTLYDHTSEDSIDVKIPNPFIVTGFLE